MQLTELELIGAVNKKNSCPESCPEIFIRNFHQMLREIPRPLGRGGIARNAKRSPLLALLLGQLSELNGCRLSTCRVVRLCPVKGLVTEALRLRSPRPCCVAALRPNPFRAYPMRVCNQGFQSLGLRKHPKVGLEPLRNVAPFNIPVRRA